VETASVIALAVSFGVFFLGVLQWIMGVIKGNDVERKALQKELDTVKEFNIDLQAEKTTLTLELNDLKLKYNRLASAAKRLKEDNDLYRTLADKNENKELSQTEITNIEAEIVLDASVQIDIEQAK
jgi:cell shape-determining protein MreC